MIQHEQLPTFVSGTLHDSVRRALLLSGRVMHGHVVYGHRHQTVVCCTPTSHCPVRQCH